MPFAHTCSIHPERIAVWQAEVAKLPARKRKNWEGALMDKRGVTTRVRYNPDGIAVGDHTSHFENSVTERRQGLRQSEQGTTEGPTQKRGSGWENTRRHHVLSRGEDATHASRG